MIPSNASLVFDLVEWIAAEPRSYGDVLDAWRTSCPRLTIWEDAVDQGFVQRASDKQGRSESICVTDRGLAFLRSKQSGKP